ncbi:selenocysteine insertion sequence-binding protein 2 isoform X2 [Esox lucius]|uniref:selenocysteine insertion sequence-binding protein 2 isoform X2 n=1 Tax=Esox lucius TaxID=8010 RepID=UPI0014768EAD|nr:selenocysteine insertion sequence-binding protein 2 isoform X2 [Esox lucius]
MEKERKWSPAVQPFVPRLQRDGVLEQQTASSPPLTLPNPYPSEENSRRLSSPPSRNPAGTSTPRDDWRMSPRQEASTNSSTRGDARSKRGYSSGRRTRGTTEAREQPTCVHHTTALKSRLEFCSPEKNMIRRSLDAPRRGGYRGTRSAPNSSERSKSAQADCVTFEVKMSDFPELGVVAPSGYALPSPQKSGTCWGSAAPCPAPTPHLQSPAPTPQLQSPAPTPHLQNPESTRKTTLVRKGQRMDPNQCIPSSENSDAYLQGQPLEAVSQSSCPAVTSWANVASQPPKKVVPKETINKTSAQETSVQQEEHASEKKKRQKKKKKKSKTAGEGWEVEEPEEMVIHQEPPKFEDEEEFPDLSLAVAGTSRVQGHNSVVFTSSMKKMDSHGEGPGLKIDDQNKDRALAGKALPTDRKKGQKAEKTSGKKSKVPVQLDIGNMLAVLEKKQQTQKDKQDAKPVILSVGGSLPVGHKNPLISKKPWLQDKIAHNPLDSTSPLVKKGKQREVPKAKKPTSLKRVILKEREDRKQNRLLEERGLPTSSQESKMASDVTEEFIETLVIDGDQLDSIDEGFSINSPSEVEEEPSRVQETNKAEQNAVQAEKDEVQAEKDEVQAEKDEVQAEKDEVQAEKDEVQAEKDEVQAEKDEVQAEKDAVQAEKDAVHSEGPINQSQSQPCPKIQPKIHSRKFRDYCSQVLSKDVDECVTNLLKELVRFQDRLYQKDPMKARMKRRLVMGLREVLKHLKLRKVKCVIISPNCERIQSKGGLDEALHNIIDTCREQGVPFVFALSRKGLGRCVNKAVPVSLVGIFNYDGAQDHYHKMIELSSEARRAYEVMIENLELKSEGALENTEGQLSTETLPEEPEYIKLWKKMLEKECNHKFLNFEAQFSSVSRASDCTEQVNEDEKS